jgi:hypothetical protein
MEVNNISQFLKVKDAILSKATVLVKKAVALKHFKLIVGALAILSLGFMFVGSGGFPSHDVMRKLVANDVEVKEGFSTIVLESFTVDSCKKIEHKKRKNPVECTITYETSVRTKASNHVSHIAASKVMIPATTDEFTFWQDDNDKWVMKQEHFYIF